MSRIIKWLCQRLVRLMLHTQVRQWECFISHLLDLTDKQFCMHGAADMLCFTDSPGFSRALTSPQALYAIYPLFSMLEKKQRLHWAADILCFTVPLGLKMSPLKAQELVK